MQLYVCRLLCVIPRGLVAAIFFHKLLPMTLPVINNTIYLYKTARL